ncbi:MAG: helix-turn-helix domain-containing protein [Clostridia bacterium]|nr:helix-turn-helix domain-containing protein [Clostridia bacterium]
MKQTTGQFLETLRKASGFTQLEVAEKLGVSNRTVSSWETDRTAPDLLILPAIADLYGVTVDEILRGERKAGVAADEISDKAKRDLRKRRFAQYGTKRAFCFGFGLLGAVIFVAACAVMLYSSAPLWLSILLMVLGVGGCISCVILLACFTFSAVRGEGIVLKEDYTEENKPYVQCVRHGTANALIWLSLPYILGAIVFLVVFFAAGLYDYRISVGEVNVEIDYTTPTAVLVSLNAVFALALFIAGYANNIAGIVKLGNGGQKSALKYNGKLFGKICGFGAIPVAVAFIFTLVFDNMVFSRTLQVHFTARSEEEIYRQFQTFKTDGVTEEQEDGSIKTIVPAGKYFLNFQSESYVELGLYYRYDEIVTGKFYDLGNGFYSLETTNYSFGISGVWWEEYESKHVWEVYHLDEGVTAQDLQSGGFYYEYMTQITRAIQTVTFDLPAPEYGIGEAYNVAYDGSPALDSGWDSEHEAPVECFYSRRLSYYEKEGEWRYEVIRSACYWKVFLIVFYSVLGATVTAGTISYFIKRKKTEYSF